MIETADYIAQARVATKAIEACEQASRAARSKIIELQILERSEQAEREDLRQIEDEDEALRQLDGDEAVPVNKERLSRLAVLHKSVPARAAAIRIQQGRVAAAEIALLKARTDLTRPVLHVIAEIQRNATDVIRGSMAQLAPEFAQLIAAYQIRHELLGDKFSIPDEDCPLPIDGLRIVQNFNKSLPDRLKVPELVDRLLSDAASAVYSEIISKIKG